ncbi:hypothetical protein N6H14_23035 [Paenibacillus sp. CC-CFT747]|nr:hypothetical protein N6H14_23035 [Paenibacillus sp. CC-CFT747]
MGIDPRIMKQLLQLQMTSRMDWASGSTASEIPSDGDAGFAGMLQLLLQTSSVEPMPAGPAPFPNYSVLSGAETGKTAGSVPSLLKPGLPPYQKAPLPPTMSLSRKRERNTG